jgi:hypothetical protein
MPFYPIQYQLVKRDLKGAGLGEPREFPRALREIPLRDGARWGSRLRSTGTQMRQSKSGEFGWLVLSLDNRKCSHILRAK